MNRDERLDRTREIPPCLHEGAKETASWIGPIDSQSDGTWIGCNERGVTACLLNLYLEVEKNGGNKRRGKRESRGSIVPRLLELGEFERMRRHLCKNFDPSPFPSFSLVLISPEDAEVLEWRGELEFEKRDLKRKGWSLVTSSSWKSHEVLDWRAEEFRRWEEEGRRESQGLPLINLHQPKGKKRWAPLMTRDYAATRSITQVRVSAKDSEAEMEYWPRTLIDRHAPDVPPPKLTLKIPIIPTAEFKSGVIRRS